MDPNSVWLSSYCTKQCVSEDSAICQTMKKYTSKKPRNENLLFQQLVQPIHLSQFIHFILFSAVYVFHQCRIFSLPWFI